MKIASTVFLSLALCLPVSAQHACPCTMDGPCPCGDACACSLTYPDAYGLAVRTNRPLLVFVRQAARKVEGCVCCRAEKYPGQVFPGVILGLPDGKGRIDEIGRRDSGSGATAEWVQTRIRDWRRYLASKELAARPAVAPALAPAFTAPARGGC